MQFDEIKIKKILIEQSYVSEKDIAGAESLVSEHGGTVLGHLLEQGLLSKDLLGQAIAESLGVPYTDLNSHQPSADQVLQVPEELALKYKVVLFSKGDGAILFATDEPLQVELMPALQALFPSERIVVTYSLSEDIANCLLAYQKPLETRFSKIIASDKRIAPEILQEIFEDAYSLHASDIHFEPQAKDVVVRFRVDGVLHQAGRLPKEYYENILNRIKVQSRLRIDEHASAQDGSMRHERDGHAIDLRTSIIPTVEGEKAVLRVLASYVQGLGLSDLGFSTKHQQMLEEAAAKPFGMILVTGPTGSGKTTTLYAVLKVLNKPDVNITTIEDPVEYKLEGANQIQVNVGTNLTFAQGLRSIVRQDPDVILVGEIRDEETAEIAVNAALTGHLLLSTFHANDAATALPRLLDMHIEPFLLASTLELVIAQRLVRKICEACRYSTSVERAKLAGIVPGIESFFADKQVTLYAGKGCASCNHTGYKGRTAIFEFIQMTPAMQDLILTHPSTKAIWDLARQQGSLSLFENGMEKVVNGVTTIEELQRIAPPPKALR